MEKQDIKAVEVFIEANIENLHRARLDFKIRGYHSPNFVYIGDIFPKEEGSLWVKPINKNTGCTVFGAKIIADYRIPVGKFKLSYRELSYREIG